MENEQIEPIQLVQRQGYPMYYTVHSKMTAPKKEILIKEEGKAPVKANEIVGVAEFTVGLEFPLKVGDPFNYFAEDHIVREITEERPAKGDHRGKACEGRSQRKGHNLSTNTIRFHGYFSNRLSA